MSHTAQDVSATQPPVGTIMGAPQPATGLTASAATNAQLGTLNSRVGDLGMAVSQQQAQATSGDLAAAAAQTRADVAHACLQDMLSIMGGVFDADDPQAALPTAASQLRQIEPACAAQEPAR